MKICGNTQCNVTTPYYIQLCAESIHNKSINKPSNSHATGSATSHSFARFLVKRSRKIG